MPCGFAIFGVRNSNATVFVEFLNYFQVKQRYRPPKARKLVISGITDTLSLNFVIFKGCLGLGMVQGQATQTQAPSSPPPTHPPTCPRTII